MADDRKEDKKDKKEDDGPDIVEVKTYVDREGRQVKEFIPQFVKKKKSSYRGLATIAERTTNPMTAPRQIPLEFAFEEGTTLMGAFKQFDDMAKVALKEFQEEVNKQQKSIIAPSGNKPILGLDGKPLK